MATWTPPSIKAMSAAPTIELVGTTLSQRYLDWFNAHPDIARTIPPLYGTFLLKYTRKYGASLQNRSEPQIVAYMDYVQYNEDLTELDLCHIIDGKKVLTVHSRYLDYQGPSVRATVSFPESTSYDEVWLQQEGVSALYMILAVQAWILYHRPELVPVELPAKSSRPRKSTSGPTSVRTIKPTRKVFIRLDETDPARSERHYRSIQWQVRGHYRRIKGTDGVRLVYVKPHLARRGEKKMASIIKLKED